MVTVRAHPTEEKGAEVNALREFSSDGRPVVGILLQELTAVGSEAKITSDTGRILRFDTTLQDTAPNRNKRLYSEAVLAEAFKAPSVQEKLKTRTMFGEANHPFTTEPARQMVVDQTRLSHIVTTLSAPSGGIVRGSIETAATDCGRDFRGLIVENGINPAFSMRGMGGVKRIPGKDLLEVTSPLALVTYDWVSFPSHKTAYADINRPLKENTALVYADQMAGYAKDQSSNVRSLMEQFEIVDPRVTINENGTASITGGGVKLLAYLEHDIRADFRAALRGLK